ncbi:TetR/AcrR family transcriptional regulator [Glycomyces artemisiae]|nr:TetR/AcrR family transcriptional regulator [Glycomyces artemisiae]
MSRTGNQRGQGARLREELIAAARALIVRPQTLELPSLRAVARDVGVAPSAVYLHFASGEDLVDAVIDEQFGELRHALESCGDDLAARAATYVRWGLSNPGAYQLLFESADRLPALADGRRPGWDLVQRLQELIAARTGRSEAAAFPIALRLWTGLHGIVSLRLHKPDLAWPTTPEDEAADAAANALRPPSGGMPE